MDGSSSLSLFVTVESDVLENCTSRALRSGGKPVKFNGKSQEEETRVQQHLLNLLFTTLVQGTLYSVLYN